MASVLQHQIEGRVNDLYFKMASHAKIIMTLSVELDRLKAENQEMKAVIKQNRSTIKRLIQDREIESSRGGDVSTSDHKESSTTKDFFKVTQSQETDNEDQE